MKHSRHGIILAAFLLFGLYFPSSLASVYSPVLSVLAYGLASVLLLVLFLRAERRPGFAFCTMYLATVPLLLVFTFTSGLNTITAGVFAPYAAISLLFITNIRDLRMPSWVLRLFEAVNWLNIVGCICILAGSKLVSDFLVNNYSAFYPDLLPNMLFLRKPVLTFATHSLAGFFLYLFFYVNFETYKVRGEKRFLVFALFYVLFTMALLSVTGLMLAGLAVFQLFHRSWSSIRYRWFWVGGATVLFSLVIAMLPESSPLIQAWDLVIKSAQSVLSSRDNGFLGRWAPGSVMYFDLQYLADHPFSPVGAGYRAEFNFVDCGMLEHLLRGSVLLFVLVYGGLVSFLKRNLLASSDFYLLLFLVLAFEFGFSSLTYSRTILLLPFLVVFLNHIRREMKDQAMMPVPQTVS